MHQGVQKTNQTRGEQHISMPLKGL